MKPPICKVCNKPIERGVFPSGMLWQPSKWMARKVHSGICDSINKSNIQIAKRPIVELSPISPLDRFILNKH